MLNAEFRDRLAKVAALANSCNPHEAQAAIGRMVALCAKEGVSLTDIIAPQPNGLAAKVAKAAKPGRANYSPIPAVLMLGHQHTDGAVITQKQAARDAGIKYPLGRARARLSGIHALQAVITKRAANVVAQ